MLIRKVSINKNLLLFSVQIYIAMLYYRRILLLYIFLTALFAILLLTLAIFQYFAFYSVKLYLNLALINIINNNV